MVRSLICCFFFAVPLSFLVAPQESPQRWSITQVQTVSHSANGRGKYLTTISYAPRSVGFKERGALRVSFVSYLHHVQRTAIVGDHAVIIGKGDFFGTVIVIDLRERRVIDRIIGYSPTLLDDKWIALVEWYPNHLFGEYPTDVVLLYNLELSPNANRPTLHTVKGESIEWMKKAGLPVFPETSAIARSYENVVEDAANTWKIIPGAFLLFARDRLLFVASRGEQFPNQKQFLVAVQLDQSNAKMGIAMEPLSADTLGLTGYGNQPLVILGLQAARKDEVRLMFPKHRYSEDSVLVHVPEE